jgi:DNA-nicking Smr family endonuclease
MPASKAPAKSQSITDAELLARALSQVIPIKGHARVIHEPPKPSSNPIRRAVSDVRANEVRASDLRAGNLHTENWGPALSDTDNGQDESLDSFRRSGVSPQTLRQVRREGQAVRECLDLHGLTRDQARAAVSHFVKSAAQHGVSRVRIIHGQGYGSANGAAVLKQQTRHWLTQMPEVLGFVTPAAREGGKGAVVVLLKSVAPSRSQT